MAQSLTPAFFHSKKSWGYSGAMAQAGADCYAVICMGTEFVVFYGYVDDCTVKGHNTMSGRDDKTKGKLDELKGNVKENIGNATGDDDMSREGRSDQSKGKGKQAVGNVKDAAGDAKDAVKDTFRKKD